MVPPACRECKGACCDVFSLTFNGLNEDTMRWLGYHGERTGDAVTFDCQCSHLVRGMCEVYDHRPEVCRRFAVGSKECIAAINRRRGFKAPAIFKIISDESHVG